jgi:hypothetical protein
MTYGATETGSAVSDLAEEELTVKEEVVVTNIQPHLDGGSSNVTEPILSPLSGSVGRDSIRDADPQVSVLPRLGEAEITKVTEATTSSISVAVEEVDGNETQLSREWQDLGKLLTKYD